jgi:ADP-ribose pyrophosphatase YjhB (NUDIX family)
LALQTGYGNVLPNRFKAARMPEAASSAILIRDGRILLIHRKNPPSFDMYAFPGGRAEPGETPDQTALREFEEETGIRAHSPREFAFYDLQAENPGRDSHASHAAQRPRLYRSA